MLKTGVYQSNPNTPALQKITNGVELENEESRFEAFAALNCQGSCGKTTLAMVQKSQAKHIFELSHNKTSQSEMETLFFKTTNRIRSDEFQEKV